MNDDQPDQLEHAKRLLGILHAWYCDPNHAAGSNAYRADLLYPGNQRKRDLGYTGNTGPLWQQVEKLLGMPEA